MSYWSDLYKIFDRSFRLDPLSATDSKKQASGAGVTQPDAIPNATTTDGSYWAGGKGIIRLRDSNDFIDLSSVTNRQSRYKEYERLENVPEVNNALNLYADEACVCGNTKVATPFGFFQIKDLVEMKKPGERFLVYCYDLENKEYTLGWAHSPRKVKTEKVIRIYLDNGKNLFCTVDHRILLKSGQWIQANQLKVGDLLMPFYRVRANKELTKCNYKQFPRIFTNSGWKTEKQVLDEWRSGKPIPKYQKLNIVSRGISAGLNLEAVAKFVKIERCNLRKKLRAEGTSYPELKYLGNHKTERRIIGISSDYSARDVYDLSVDKYENFATDSLIVHNCQINEKNYVFNVKCKSDIVKKELDFALHQLWEVDNCAWNWMRQLCKYGDLFVENTIFEDDPKAGIQSLNVLPADSMYRIETTKGKLLEFQQAKSGPDYQSLARVEVTRASEADLAQATALRFAPEQIMHAKIGDDRKTFYPYGVSMLEAARGPVQQLTLCQDQMLVYRLVRGTERKVFYVDIGDLPPYKEEAYMQRMIDQLRKRKLSKNTASSDGKGPGAVDERWSAPSIEEDYWVPLRKGSQTRIENLPGAGFVAEVDDSLYFRERVYIALQVPKTHFNPPDIPTAAKTVSSQNASFSCLISRLQRGLVTGVTQVAKRHLFLRGIPEELYDDLILEMTVPSEYRKLSLNEVKDIDYNRAASMKGAGFMSDFDILVLILGKSEVEAREIVARMKQQKLDELKIQIMGQNPSLFGLDAAPPAKENELGTTSEGPNPPTEQSPEQPTENPQPEKSANHIEEPSEEDIKKYNMQIGGSSNNIDREEIDKSEGN